MAFVGSAILTVLTQGNGPVDLYPYIPDGMHPTLVHWPISGNVEVYWRPRRGTTLPIARSLDSTRLKLVIHVPACSPSCAEHPFIIAETSPNHDGMKPAIVGCVWSSEWVDERHSLEQSEFRTRMHSGNTWNHSSLFPWHSVFGT